ncbi:MAG TPA: hypothetical protein VN739_08990 [Nitrososphaerales archaeon]|nr:hypothetical protein [Nitrososphaerales archaeon]
MSARSLETGELLSFLLVAATMLSSSLFFPSFYWVFILFAIIDGLSTRYKSELALSLDRIFFAFIILLLSAESLGLDVLLMILETAALIALLDISFLLRQIRQHSQHDLSTILSSRFRSYLYTLLPAALLSSGLTYLGASSLSFAVNSQYAILELGLASAAVFVIILGVARKETLK